MSQAVSQTNARLRIDVGGAVQGVGFRPFVYRLARRLRLGGSILNSGSGVEIDVEGDPRALEDFVARLPRDAPSAAWITSIQVRHVEPSGASQFVISESARGAERTAAVLPDRAVCDACRREILDPADRRADYPFTNCVDCGPRYTILRAIPYDRPNTTMARFVMCETCRREYEDPENRRFHAQPNACPRCGPRLEFRDAAGLLQQGGPLHRAADLIRDGGILALKGIGGFQLLVDARSGEAVRRLRLRKHREEKPFAVMFPSLHAVRACCAVDALEETVLLGPAAPIVLLRPNGGAWIAREASGASPYVGALLPYSPLHHLLLGTLGVPVVATSGNRSDEPIVTDNDEAIRRLGRIADGFLWHDREIARPCDDSVARVVGGRATILRRARGYAPLPIPVRRELRRVLALGAHLKNAIAIASGRQIVVGQHIGDLDTEEAREAFRRSVEDLSRLHGFKPDLVACDLHPDYFPTRHAESLGLPVIRIQHHQAHVASCAADNELEGGYLGVAWDGTGYGLDGTIWGGEFLLWDEREFRRVGRLRPFRLPGGDAGVRDGRRSAFGLLHQIPGGSSRAPLALTEPERAILTRLIERGINAPVTTSAGRLFDAVAAIAGVAVGSRFEGEAAMSLESAIGAGGGDDAYPLPLREEEILEIDWRPLIDAVVDDASRGRPVAEIALRFHNALAEVITAVARRVGCARVVLSGGVFQNGYLSERARVRLEQERFEVYTHRRVPPNDGGIALGQAILASTAS